MLARADDDKDVGVAELRRLDHPEVCCVAFTPDSRRLLSGNRGESFKGGKASPVDCTVRVWDVATGKLLRDVTLHTGGSVVAFSRDGRQALSSSSIGGDEEKDVALRLWDVGTGKELRRLKLSKDAGIAAVSPDGQRFLAVDEGGGSLRLWDLRSGTELRRFEGHRGPVEAVAFSRDGRRALSGGHDQSVRLWDVASGKELRRLDGHQDRVTSVVFSPDGRRAISAGGNYNSSKGAADASIRVWDLATGKELRRFNEGEKVAVMHIALAPNGRRVLSSGVFSLDSPSEATIRVWDVESGKLLHRFRGHVQDGIAVLIVDLAISPNGRYAASAGIDGTVRLWALPR